WPPEAGPDVVRVYRDFLEAAPDEVGGGVIHMTAPPEDFVPGDMVGRLACGVLITYAGETQEMRDVAEPVLGLSPDAEMATECSYADLQCLFDDPPGYRNYWSAEYLGSFPDPAVDRFCARAADLIVP